MKKNAKSKAFKPKNADEIADFIRRKIKVLGWFKDDYCSIYSFSDCPNLSLMNPSVYVDTNKKDVHLDFTLRFLSENAHVINNVSTTFNKKNADTIIKELRTLYRGVKNQKVFKGSKFDERLFNKLNLESKGWEIL